MGKVTSQGIYVGDAYDRSGEKLGIHMDADVKFSTLFSNEQA